MSFRYSYARPALTVDCVIFGFDEGALKVLLIRRGLPPFEGKWALPGGFVRVDEGLEEAARRELREETGLEAVHLEQLGAFGAVDRDPRERVVSVAWCALVKQAAHVVRGGTDAAEARWFPVAEAPSLAFDHDAMLAAALADLQGRLRRQPVGFDLLPPRFTLSQLQHLYEAVLGTPLDKRNFRKRVLATGLLKPAGRSAGGAGRPAALHRFDPVKYARLTKRGFHFDL